MITGANFPPFTIPAAFATIEIFQFIYGLFQLPALAGFIKRPVFLAMRALVNETQTDTNHKQQNQYEKCHLMTLIYLMSLSGRVVEMSGLGPTATILSLRKSFLVFSLLALMSFGFVVSLSRRVFYMSVRGPTTAILSFAWPKESIQRKGHPMPLESLGTFIYLALRVLSHANRLSCRFALCSEGFERGFRKGYP
ncbi:hypothetical protein [Methylomonas sp. CM2]|uniref:hypothetical protein n=1 Tax=Methylomonas sp. CM2 TaxID=3417647 RepID=UPI003CEAC2E5